MIKKELLHALKFYDNDSQIKVMVPFTGKDNSKVTETVGIKKIACGKYTVFLETEEVKHD